MSAPDNLVRKADVEQAMENAQRKEVPPDRVYIHHIRNGFFLDGRPVDNPQTMQGEELEAAYWHVHGEEKKVSDHIHVINGFSLQVENIIVSGIASGSIIASAVEKQNGILVLDIGCGVTDYVLYHHGKILRTGVIGIGGDHFTNDLSLGLRVSAQQAEKLKLDFGKASMVEEDKKEKVWLFGDLTIGDRALSKETIYRILQLRAEELFQIVKKELGGALKARDLPGGVILTGGASRLPHIAEVGTGVLGLPVRTGENPSWVRKDLRKPEYSTALGLLYYGLEAQREEEETATSRKGIFSKMAKIFAFK